MNIQIKHPLVQSGQVRVWANTVSPQLERGYKRMLTIRHLDTDCCCVDWHGGRIALGEFLGRLHAFKVIG